MQSRRQVCRCATGSFMWFQGQDASGYREMGVCGPGVGQMAITE